MAQSQITSALPVEWSPVPEPAGGPTSPLQEPTGNGPAGPAVVPVIPAAEHVAGPAGNEKAIEITPEEKAALATLISRAAMADGFKGKGYVRAWLQTHYKIDVSDIAGIPPEIRARVRADALSVLERREQETPRKPPAPTTPL